VVVALPGLKTWETTRQVVPILADGELPYRIRAARSTGRTLVIAWAACPYRPQKPPPPPPGAPVNGLHQPEAVLRPRARNRMSASGPSGLVRSLGR